MASPAWLLEMTVLSPPHHLPRACKGSASPEPIRGHNYHNAQDGYMISLSKNSIPRLWSAIRWKDAHFSNTAVREPSSSSPVWPNVQAGFDSTTDRSMSMCVSEKQPPLPKKKKKKVFSL